MSTSPKGFTRRDFVRAASAAGIAPTLGISSAQAQKKYAPGVTDTEIKIGQSLPYSGPASAYGAIGRAQTAYFKMVNDRGGINGRKINFISLDDGFTPPKALENVRRLVEQDEVAFIFCVLGTPLNLAVRPYLNQKKVPHLFNAAGSQRFADPEKFPWTMGWQPSLRNESVFYAKRVAPCALNLSWVNFFVQVKVK
jgi:branched-chain amino acid transport system substrate-binding protein